MTPFSFKYRCRVVGLLKYRSGNFNVEFQFLFGAVRNWQLLFVGAALLIGSVVEIVALRNGTSHVIHLQRKLPH